MRAGVVVLASGEGRRFGGNKLLAPFNGRPLIAHTLAALPRELFARRLVVTRSAEVAAIAESMGFETLLHSLPDVSDTIRLGVSTMSETDGCLFCVGDQPYISADTVGRIISAFADEPTRIYRAAFGNRLGNPVLFPKELYGELASLAEGQSGGAVIARHKELVRAIEAATADELADIDTREDYQRLTRERD